MIKVRYSTGSGKYLIQLAIHESIYLIAHTIKIYLFAMK